MTPHENPGLARRRLRTVLREAREDSGLTQREAASEMDWSLSKVVRIEAGTVGVSTNDLRALLELYQHSDPDEAAQLIELARLGRRRPWFSEYQDVLDPDFERFLGYEAAASLIMAFHPLTIPGLLQTERYARAILEADHAVGVPRRLELRLKRQNALLRDDRPELRYILDEAALHRLVGGREVMISQLQRLVEAAQEPRTSVQAIPFSAGAHSSMSGSFTVLEFGSDDADVLYREIGVTNVAEREDEDLVNSFRNRFGELEGLALSREETLGLIKRHITELQDAAGELETR